MVNRQQTQVSAPQIPEPQRANPHSPPPPSSPRSTSSPPPTPPRNRQHNNRYSPPSPPTNNPRSPPRANAYSNYNPEGVGHNLHDSFAILGFTLEDGVTERQVRRRYMEMARIHHPDKNDPTKTGRNHDEATQFFQLLNNAQSYLRDWL